ncbi:hypothetical protein N7507_005129 [Penicillium longicatenatum]|nr:hypothetical protein N7507_005129 [Penicillium longicatenatum]
MLVLSPQDESEYSTPMGTIDGDAPEETTDEPVEEIFYIQVSAKHLKRASPFFRSLFLGAGDKSQIYELNGLTYIDEYGWDLDALLIVLRGIHDQHQDIPENLTLEMIAKVAHIMKHYGCKKALSSMISKWITNLEDIPTTYSQDLMLWVWISWAFKLPAQYNQSTSVAMSCSKNEFNNWTIPLPRSIIELMNRGRQEAIEYLLISLHNTHETFQLGHGGCDVLRSSLCGSFSTMLQCTIFLAMDHDVPFKNLNYTSLVEMILTFHAKAYCAHCTSLLPFVELNGSVGGLFLHQRS